MTTIDNVTNILQGMIFLADTLTSQEIKQVAQALIDDLQEYQQSTEGTPVCRACREGRTASQNIHPEPVQRSSQYNPWLGRTILKPIRVLVVDDQAVVRQAISDDGEY